MKTSKKAQYFFSKIETGYENIHSFIRENFNSHNKSTPAIVCGDLIVVQSDFNPVKSNPLIKREVLLLEKETKKVKIKAHLSFDNRHKTGNIIPPRLTPKDALKKLETLAGLTSLDDSNIVFLGCHREKKFNVHNTFKFEGWFQIMDPEKFNKSLLEGVGSRKSYGYGLILVEEEGK